MKLKVLLIVIAITSCLVMCHSDGQNPTPVVAPPKGVTEHSNLNKPPEAGKINILFVGNSLTYFNNLPVLVEQVATQSGKEVCSVGSMDQDGVPDLVVIDIEGERCAV